MVGVISPAAMSLRGAAVRGGPHRLPDNRCSRPLRQVDGLLGGSGTGDVQRLPGLQRAGGTRSCLQHPDHPTESNRSDHLLDEHLDANPSRDRAWLASHGSSQVVGPNRVDSRLARAALQGVENGLNGQGVWLPPRKSMGRAVISVTARFSLSLSPSDGFARCLPHASSCGRHTRLRASRPLLALAVALLPVEVGGC
jgi:hypothetical protein